jgi:nucleotidyltransferase/DNA polymerase involved in DNA repair
VAKLTDVPGLTPMEEVRLRSAGIRSTRTLLWEAGSRVGRSTVAGQTGIGEDRLLHLAQRADLMRVRGVGGEYAELLEAAGVATVPDLAHQKPERLRERLAALNGHRDLVRRVPSLRMVTRWVHEAYDLGVAITR